VNTDRTHVAEAGIVMVVAAALLAVILHRPASSVTQVVPAAPSPPVVVPQPVPAPSPYPYPWWRPWWRPWWYRETEVHSRPIEAAPLWLRVLTWPFRPHLPRPPRPAPKGVLACGT